MSKHGTEITQEHPSHEDLASIAEGSASEWLREQIHGHIKECEKCNFVITELVKSVDEMPDFELENKDHPISLKVINKKEDAKREENEKESRPWRYPGDTFNGWIAGSLILLSVIVPDYQVHLLVAAAFFGLLAVIDYSHRNIFSPLINAWRDGDEEKASEVIENLKDRFKVG